MIGKLSATLILATLLTASTEMANAQLLEPAGTPETTIITVGTTTYETAFPTAILRSATDRLQEILYYLRTFDSPVSAQAPDSKAAPVAGETLNVYTDIANTAFADGAANSTAIEDVISKASEPCYVFKESLEIGDKSPEVLKIQRFLNRVLETPIATSGPGSRGEETDYFGPLTFDAVLAYQGRYADEILEPLGLIAPTGYWGASTIVHANALSGCIEK
ncbi:hypothetical protein CL652_02215 [bacterium]|nr:hypothetical protein [bacterium]|tara:strand:+ start:9457 stop:10116 length:660 start_codon:yes stop_codon:yes gene_type:complete